MRVLNHLLHGCCYAAILYGEASGNPLGHLFKVGGYGVLMSVAIVAISHALISTIIDRLNGLKRRKKEPAEDR